MEQAYETMDAAAYASLSEHIHSLHDRILEFAPGIERMACALYDPREDTLKTFINSTRHGDALARYEYPLSDSYSLSELAASGNSRLLTNLPDEINTGSAHSDWVLEQGYQSSYTVPMTYQDSLLGFLFFDSTKADTFTTEVQRELALYGRLMTLAIANELMVIRSILGSVQVAREFAALRDLETGAHLERVARYARLVAKDVADQHGKSDEWVEAVFLYAPLHDIGKIGIPDDILLKRGPLDPDEWETMKTHTTLGVEMVDTITARLGLPQATSTDIVRNIVGLHHEAMDGSGYPNGLAGDDIPLEARVVSVVDILDALTSARHYKPAWSFDDALGELRGLAERGVLDATLVDSLVRQRDEVTAICDRYQDA